jgi:hypothetical protein
MTRLRITILLLLALAGTAEGNSVFTTGFEAGDLSELLSHTATVVTASTAQEYAGTYSMRVLPGSYGTGYGRTTTFSASTSYTRFWFRYHVKTAISGGVGRIAEVWDTAANPKFTLGVSDTGHLAVRDRGGNLIGSAGTSTLSVDTWYKLEMKVGCGSSGYSSDAPWEVRLGGVSEISGTTGMLSNVNCGSVIFGRTTNSFDSTAVDYYYDSVAIDDYGYPDDQVAYTGFSLTNSAITAGGYWVNGGTTLQPYGKCSSLAVRITGTDAKILSSVTVSTSFEVSIDGGAFTGATYAGANYIWLFTGLSDAARDVEIRATSSAYGSGQPTFTVANGLRVAGAAPAIAGHSVLGGPVESVVSTNFANLGWSNAPVYTDAQYGYDSQCRGLNVDGVIYRRLTASAIRVWIHGATGAHFSVWTGATKINEAEVTSADFGWFTLATGLDAGTEKEYRIYNSVTSGGTVLPIVQIMAFGGSFGSGAVASHPVIACLGDSTTACVTGGSSARGWVQKLGNSYHAYNSGVGGNKISDMDTRWAASIGALTGLNAVIFIGGANPEDAGQDAAANAALERPYVDSIITKALAYDTHLKLIVAETLPGAGQRQGTMLAAAVTAAANSRVSYLDTDGWIDPTSGVDTVDGIHPNDSGGTKIAAQFLTDLGPLFGPAMAVILHHLQMQGICP